MNNIKELLFIFIVSIINICITFIFTKILGIANIVIFKSYLFSIGNITWEFLIFMTLLIIESYFYEYHMNKN